MALINYPAGLPNPLMEGHSLQPGQTFTRTALASGRARQRKSFANVPVLGDWNFLYTSAQAQAFEAWFRDVLLNGMEYFNMPRLTPLGLRMLECRFTAMYAGPTLVGRNLWRYTMPLEISERTLVGEGWGEMPGFVIGSSIIDVAANREWPEA